MARALFAAFCRSFAFAKLVSVATLVSLPLGCGGDGSAPIGPDDDAFVDAGFIDSGSELDANVPIDATTDSRSDAIGVIDVGVDTKPDTKPDVGGDASAACLADLTAKGISYKLTAARGVVDAVNVLGPINGVLFANGTDPRPMGDPVACQFVRTLYSFADLLKEKGFVRVGTLGSYCYRCCCAWSTTNFCRGLTDSEPVCGTSGLSNHSFGRAIDVRYLYKADGTRYDVDDPAQFVKWATTETCTKGLPGQTGISKELYTLACEATARKIFGTVLTPNYNADHRNHFHMDIGESGTPTSWTTKSKSSNPHVGLDDAVEICGDE